MLESYYEAETFIMPVHVNYERVDYALLDSFRFNKHGRCLWLQRACFWLLKRLGARAVTQSTVCQQTTVVNLDRLVDTIMAHRRNVRLLAQMIGQQWRPKYLLVGEEEFAELAVIAPALGPVNTTGIFNFRFPAGYHARVGFDNRPMPSLFAGMTVVVVPWVRGCVILPDMEELARLV